MKQKLFFGLIALSIVVAQCQSPNSSNNVSYQSAKMTLEQQEQANPTGYLKVTGGTFRKNLLGTWVIEGNTTSNATVAKYKDAVLTVGFYTKTNTLLSSKDFAQYEFIGPGKSVPFTIRTDGPQGTELISVNVKSASIAN